MDKRFDLNPELFRIEEAFQKGARINNCKNPDMPEELLKKINFVKDQLINKLPLNVVDIIIVAKLLSHQRERQGEDNHPRVRDLLRDVFDTSVPLSEGLDIIRRLVEKEGVRTNSYAGKPVTVAQQMLGYGNITDMYDDDVYLSRYALACIVCDKMTQGHYGHRPYASNIEFLNDWEAALDYAENAEMNFQMRWAYSYAVHGAVGAQREMERIARRLTVTEIPIPLQQLIDKHALTTQEQLVIMYDLHLGDKPVEYPVLRNSVILSPDESPFCLDRKPLSKNSRLVRLGIFVKREEIDTDKEYSYRLAPNVRDYILGEAALLRDEPLLK
ncbi:MAG: hypothetical protein DRP45_06110 [Candidatus Zixiibacteriota bacterium]|nr:MAG: hypothetical protein DRP45_06110 [candidate division Zixibacteria bacterium]